MKVTMVLQNQGKNLKKKVDNLEKRTQNNVLRAKNSAGTKTANQMHRALSKFLNVPSKKLKQRFKIFRATRYNPTFRASWYRKSPRGGSIAIPIEETAGVRQGKSHLTIKAYNKKQKFEKAFRIRNKYFRRSRDRKRVKRITGVFIKEDYGPVRGMKDGLKARTIKEFRRLMDKGIK